MKHIFAILLFLYGISIYAQQAYDSHKMSDFLCELIHTQHQGRAKGVHEFSQASVTILMKFNQEGCASSMAKEYGYQLIDSIGHIYIVRIPIAQLGQLSLDNRVKRIDAHEMPRPTMDETPTRVGAAKAWNGTSSLPQAYTGEGVLAGVVDIGFDFTHPMFLDAEGNSRILQFFAPVKDSDGELQWNTYNSQEVTNLRHSPFATYQYHGTHVASIMAGSAVRGEKGTYSGIAPESDLMVVEFGTDKVGSSTASVTTADLVLYCKKIFDEAGTLNQPCVINLSAGGYVLISDDMSTEDEAIHSMLGAGRILVASAGNYGGLPATMTKKLGEEEVMAHFYGAYFNDSISSQSKAERIDCCLLTNYPQQVEFHLGYDDWYSKPIKTIVIRTDSIDSIGDTCIIQDTLHLAFDVKTTIKAYKKANPHKTAPLYYLTLEADLHEWAGYWKESYDYSFSNFLDITGISVSINSDYPCEMYTNPEYTPFTLVRNFKTGEYDECISCSHTIGWPASIDDVVAAGAMNTRRGKNWLTGEELPPQLASFSSQGPNWDNQIKPEVVAPGSNIRAAYNQYFGSSDNPYDSIQFVGDGSIHYIISASGTSMSSPVVAGAIALWLQAKPDLTPTEIMEVLAETCSHPEADEEYPNIRYGYGEIDVYRGLLHILGLADKIEDLSANQPAALRFQLDGRSLTVIDAATSAPLTNPATLIVYATDGRIVATASDSIIDLSHLPNGLYAVQVKTGKKETTGSTLIRL